ncbi:hypothetical protein [Streptacidiphilus sp. PAMC 29251]
MTTVTVLVDATVVGSTAGALVWRRAASGAGGRRRWWTAGGPEAALALVVGLILLNQVLVSVYVLRVHGGDSSFVTRYLAPGWFETDQGNPLIRRLATAWPAPRLLSPTILRSQALLELPFGLLAYLSALRWLDPGLYRRVARSPLIACASVAYTVVFCAVEWFFHSPYTAWDIGLRVVSAVLTPLWIAAIAGREQGESRTSSASELLLFCGAAGALGYLVLVLYGTVLLYNLGLLGAQLPRAAVALAILITCRVLAARLRKTAPPGPPPGPALAAAGSCLRWFLVLFFAPALAVRYAVNFGNLSVAIAAAGVLALTACQLALRESDDRSARLLLTLIGATVLGLLAGYAAARAVTDPYYEATVLRGFAAFAVTVLAACWLADRFQGDKGDSRAGAPSAFHGGDAR